MFVVVSRYLFYLLGRPSIQILVWLFAVCSMLSGARGQDVESCNHLVLVADVLTSSSVSICSSGSPRVDNVVTSLLVLVES